MIQVNLYLMYHVWKQNSPNLCFKFERFFEMWTAFQIFFKIKSYLSILCLLGSGNYKTKKNGNVKHAWFFIFKMKFGKVLNFWHRKILSLISFFVYILLLYLVVSWFLWLWSHPKVSVLMNMPAEKAFKEKIVKDMMEYPCSVIWAKKHAICIWVVLIHFTKLV